MNKQKPVDLESLNADSIVLDAEKTMAEKGSRDITDEANGSVDESPFLKAVSDACGGNPFRCVLLSPWKDKTVGLVVLKKNNEYITAKLPAAMQQQLAVLTSKFEKLGTRSPAFNAFKVAIVGGTVGGVLYEGYLTKALRKASEGAIVLETPEDTGPRAINFQFTEHWTDEERIEATNRRREQRASRADAGDFRNRMRNLVNNQTPKA